MKLRGVLAAAAAAGLGFASVTVVGGALRPRRPVAQDGAAAVAEESRGEPARRCDRRSRLSDLDKLETSLASQIDELTAADATARFLPPRDLPARFSGPAVRTAVEAAIGATGVDGRVDEVDCSAYPCLVIGHYARHDQLGKLQRELRLRPEYSTDVMMVMPMGEDPAGGTLVGAIAFPRNEPRAAEIVEAFRRRRADALTKRVGEPG
jgi:hypothetical protein